MSCGRRHRSCLAPGGSPATHAAETATDDWRRLDARNASPTAGKDRPAKAGRSPLRAVRVVDVDFTSAPSRRKPITAAHGRLDGDHVVVESIDALQDWAAFEALPLPAEQRRLIAGANVLRFLGVPA